jgi:hypothetical protein
VERTSKATGLIRFPTVGGTHGKLAPKHPALGLQTVEG